MGSWTIIVCSTTDKIQTKRNLKYVHLTIYNKVAQGVRQAESDGYSKLIDHKTEETSIIYRDSCQTLSEFIAICYRFSLKENSTN